MQKKYTNLSAMNEEFNKRFSEFNSMIPESEKSRIQSF